MVKLCVMTNCIKPVKRKVRCESSWTRGNDVIITIYPHGEIGFRLPRKRAEYKLSTATAYETAVKITTNKLTARIKSLRKDGYSLPEARRKAQKELL